jgi:metal-responsive CopG/Arc/MetJ family transcriptional regulator
VSLPPDVRQGLDRLVSRRAHQTGQSTHRADLIREALAMYLRHAENQEK